MISIKCFLVQHFRANDNKRTLKDTAQLRLLIRGSLVQVQQQEQPQ